MKSAIIKLVVGMAITLMFVTPVSAQTFTPANLLALRDQATIKRLGKYDPKDRLAYYETVDRLTKRLLYSPTYAVIKTMRGTAFGDSYPRSAFIDRDGDGIPDECAYLTKSGGSSPEFGFIYDMNGDGQADYIIFNGGLEASSMKFESMVWRNYHLIDTNYDGHIDVMVVNSIGLHEKHVVDAGVYAWLYDINHDGKIDDGEYLGRNIEKPLEKDQGKFIVRYAWLGPKKYDADTLKTWDRVLHEVKGDYASLMASLPRRPVTVPEIKVVARNTPESGSSSFNGKKRIDLGSFIVSPPPGSDWKILIDKQHESIRFVKTESGSSGRAAVMIHVNRNRANWQNRYTTEEEIADEYTFGEERDMRTRGKGKYTVDDVQRGVAQLSGKNLYYMRYKTSGSVTQNSALFLLFPSDFYHDRYFYMFLISDACGGACSMPKGDFDPAFSVIESLRIK